MIASAIGVNPTKLPGTENKLLPHLNQMLDEWRKMDPPPSKKHPVEADVPEYLCHLKQSKTITPLEAAVGDLTLIAFYYLLRVGKYTTKGARNSSKQTVQFKMEDITFFHKDSKGGLCQLGWNAPATLIMTAASTTLKLDNQKNGWKLVCIHQETNGESIACPVGALCRHYLAIRAHSQNQKLPLSS